MNKIADPILIVIIFVLFFVTLFVHRIVRARRLKKIARAYGLSYVRKERQGSLVATSLDDKIFCSRITGVYGGRKIDIADVNSTYFGKTVESIPKLKKFLFVLTFTSRYTNGRGWRTIIDGKMYDPLFSVCAVQKYIETGEINSEPI